jgi:hypothetical protein
VFLVPLAVYLSVMSQAFIRASRGALDEVNSRSLGRYNFASFMVDGVGFAERTVVVALGITATGEKLILGLREGESENWEVAKDLFESLVARGLRSDQPMLFVIDGSKALRKAINKVFGKAPVQRCVRHKERNVISYLPSDRVLEFRRRWKKLHAMSDYASAKREYDDLVHWLGHINHCSSVAGKGSRRNAHRDQAECPAASEVDPFIHQSDRVDVLNPEAQSGTSEELEIRPQSSSEVGGDGAARCGEEISKGQGPHAYEQTDRIIENIFC